MLIGIVEYKFPPTVVPGGVKAEAETGIAGKGSVLPAIGLPPTCDGFFCRENKKHFVRNCFQASSVFPDQIQNPDVIPTARVMKYLSIRTEKSGYDPCPRVVHPGHKDTLYKMELQ